VTRNSAASARQRLLNRAKAEGRPFTEILQYFALERFLYRLGRSRYSNQFVLKGALMFDVWQGLYSDAPANLHEAVQVIAAFLQPTILALSEGRAFDRHWSPGGPWTDRS